MPPKKAPAAKPVLTKPAGVKATARPAAAPDFTTLVILSPGAELTAVETELRLRAVTRHHGRTTLPPVLRVAEIDATPDATALALYRAFRALGRGGPALFLCAGQPTEGALSVLQTDWGNTFLAPNDGTLGLLAALFQQRNIPFTLSALHTELILESEQERMQNPEWSPAADFALRDVLAPAAALLLTGRTAQALTASATRTNVAGLQPARTAFAAQLRPLPQRLNEPLNVRIIATTDARDGQHHLLNVTLDPLSFDQLLDDRARFVLSMPHPCRLHRWLGLSRKVVLHAHGPDHPAGHAPGSPSTCCHAHLGCGAHASQRVRHLHLSPHPAPAWDERFLSLHLSGCHATALHGPLTLTRIR